MAGLLRCLGRNSLCRLAGNSIRVEYNRDLKPLAALAEQVKEATVINAAALKHIDTARTLAAQWSPD